MAIWAQCKTILPRAITSAIVAIIFVCLNLPVTQEKLHSIAGVLVGLAGTLLGFLITAMALLTAVMDRKLVANMRKTGHYQRLIEDTFSTCVFLLIQIILSVISLFIIDSSLHYLFPIIIYFTMLSLLYLVRVGSRFSTVIAVLE